jgi:hypothetical protein
VTSTTAIESDRRRVAVTLLRLGRVEIETSHRQPDPHSLSATETTVSHERHQPAPLAAAIPRLPFRRQQVRPDQINSHQHSHAGVTQSSLHLLDHVAVVAVASHMTLPATGLGPHHVADLGVVDRAAVASMAEAPHLVPVDLVAVPHPFAPPFRGSSNSTATTYPRTMRFRDHLSDLPKEVPGGQKAPEVYDKSKLLKLEEDARRLRELIDKKEDEKRQKLREWDGLERDANNAQLRVELAETSLRELDGDTDISNAF